MRTLQQLVTFGAIGIASNAALYALYLVLTGLDVGPKAAMTSVFILGVACTYSLNRRWTFRHDGAVSRSAVRYAGVYGVAYAMNVAALALLVDIAKLPHQAVMLGLIVATAGLIFILQKFWVFGVQIDAQGTHWSR
jgi:putative flippase GtrA